MADRNFQYMPTASFEVGLDQLGSILFRLPIFLRFLQADNFRISFKKGDPL
jgi:hypothetical protein